MANHHLFFIVSISLTILSIPQASSDTRPPSTKRLFVFGDSYFDTGNTDPRFPAWRPPYGISLGGPTGRFSDGRVGTDYLASLMGLDPLTPSSRVDASNPTATRNGVNFAVSSSSISPNMFNFTMEVQINRFLEMEKGGAFNQCDLENSVGFVSIGINDYLAYHLIDFPKATIILVEELKEKLRILQKSGIGKVLVASLPPLGCIPDHTIDGEYPASCNQTKNERARSHNEALKVAVDGLKEENREKRIEYVNFYRGFTVAMDGLARTGIEEYSDPTKPCCGGKGEWCGNVDENGVPKYKLCEHPLQSFFWDGVHPSQHGWELVFEALKEDFEKLLA